MGNFRNRLIAFRGLRVVEAVVPTAFALFGGWHSHPIKSNF
jgi:hypothetical protein